MPRSIQEHLASLQTVLLSLENTGEVGFEGLIATILSDISGRPFRLASSGSQHGRDGESQFDAGTTYFEAKLYSKSLPKNEVLSKVLEAGLGADGDLDLWVFGSTQPISAQHSWLIEKAAEKFGFGLLLLDWSTSSLPPLAVALALSSDAVLRFFDHHRPGGKDRSAIAASLRAIAVDSRYGEAVAALRQAVCSPSLGIGLAVARSEAWLLSVFGSRALAQAAFGQPLAPADPALLSAQTRPILVERLRPAFFETPGVFVVRGDEGSGKSWLVAQTWLLSDRRPLMLLLTPDELTGAPTVERFQELVVAKLIRQTSEDDRVVPVPDDP